MQRSKQEQQAKRIKASKVVIHWRTAYPTIQKLHNTPTNKLDLELVLLQPQEQPKLALAQVPRLGLVLVPQGEALPLLLALVLALE